MSNIQSTALNTYTNGCSHYCYAIWPGNKYRDALEKILKTIGPQDMDCSVNECEGCQYEMAEVLRIAAEALGRDIPNPPQHPHRKAKK